jgi:hypothetical protein
MKTVTMHTAAIQAAFRELREAAHFALANKTPYAVSSICSAVANIIQGAGSYGGHPQKTLMDAATAAGFSPEFYAGGIRVGYHPKVESKPEDLETDALVARIAAKYDAARGQRNSRKAYAAEWKVLVSRVGTEEAERLVDQA